MGIYIFNDEDNNVVNFCGNDDIDGFKEYIDKWISRKNNATIEKNYGQRTLAKLMLNSLYGKFATKLETKSKFPYLR